ncbi:ribosome maturation factor RimP [Candidatus Nitrospira inopinata]|uniref:ribosome maturation factor RimP n=1 Tax=Candidatus Nitrospira inopinata TaxID=1715989 RepID=UPI000A698B95|nr:ribosome maturation factor RimP [Candidatus Nitrospira inopinata]
MSTKSRVAHSVVDRVQDAVLPILWALGLELVEVVWAGQGSRSVLRIVIDKPGGVTVTDCERAHKALGPALDVADLIPHAYTLEVSSPGLDRPFKRLQDYQRAIGKDVSLKLRQPLNGQWRLVGRLEAVNEQGVCLSVAGGANEPERVTLDRESIAEAKLVVKI